MRYFSQAYSNSGRCLPAIIAVITVFCLSALANAQTTKTPTPKQQMEREVSECVEDYMKREPTNDLGQSQYREKISDLCNKSVLEAPKVTPGEEPTTNDYYFSGDAGGFVYDLDKDCKQVRLQDELIFICPQGKFKPTIRNNQSGFMPYFVEEEPAMTTEKPEAGSDR
ncbi:hypothetical protein [Pseudovibrio sp. Tun.PSC04-5.I4]|uniref:hypothetical protein n=1 Tax=Pseudovibrio sp. Tun.PSC04-5.I4 TaxID=1798213 RepID=UPI00088AE7EB|nr:hypothetical protein [Pseudovibrio sp. Tun.PSC04-5.I4]SDR26072.1 hypothetical protein SAMN04515695_3880 [Pseudovibrio sp. Tun.PSC04-5.I4]